MKVKTLRYKEEHNPFKEFVHLKKMNGAYQKFTSDIPKLQPVTATMELLKKAYPLEECDFDSFDDLELVEFELVEKNTVGADIRNKLSPSLNLVSLLEIFFEPKIAHVSEERAKLAELIQEEMKKSKESIEYIANLL